MARQNREQSYVNFTIGKKEKRSLKQLEETVKPHGIHIYEDLAEETIAKRRELLPDLKRAKEEGKIVYFSYDKLVMKERPPAIFPANRVI